MVVRPTKSFLALHPLRQQFADDDRNHRAEMADHRELACLRTAAVNISVASAHRALPRTKISASDVEERLTERGPSRLIANERRKDIAFLQKHPARRADRFLAFAEVNAAGDHAAAIKTRQFLLENPRLQHAAKRLEIFLVRRFFRNGSAAFRSLKHLRFSH